jgi:hypothetical protein
LENVKILPFAFIIRVWIILPFPSTFFLSLILQIWKDKIELQLENGGVSSNPSCVGGIGRRIMVLGCSGKKRDSLSDK